jgi:hypothetical protein
MNTASDIWRKTQPNFRFVVTNLSLIMSEFLRSTSLSVGDTRSCLVSTVVPFCMWIILYKTSFYLQCEHRSVYTHNEEIHVQVTEPNFLQHTSSPAKRGLKMGYSSWSTTRVLYAPMNVCYIIYECPSAFFLTCFMFVEFVRETLCRWNPRVKFDLRAMRNLGTQSTASSRVPLSLTHLTSFIS